LSTIKNIFWQVGGAVGEQICHRWWGKWSRVCG